MTTHIPTEYTVLKPFSRYKKGDIVKLPSNVNSFSWLEGSLTPYSFTEVSRTVDSLINTNHISKGFIVPIECWEEIKEMPFEATLGTLKWTHDKGYTQLYLVTTVNNKGDK